MAEGVEKISLFHKLAARQQKSSVAKWFQFQVVGVFTQDWDARGKNREQYKSANALMTMAMSCLLY